MSDDAVLVVGLDDQPTPTPPPPRRIGWAALAVVAGLAIWLGGSFDLEPTPTDDPAPLPVAEPPPDPTGGRTWAEVEGGGDGVVDAGGPVLLGIQSWDPDGGSRSKHFLDRRFAKTSRDPDKRCGKMPAPAPR
ncbi:MAG: hypothetical protein AB1Z57_10230 [Acidimicrobiia bacterium]